MPNDQQIARAMYAKFVSQFKCLNCGKCCTENAALPPAGILLQDGDIDRLCQGLKISRRKFKDLYTVVGPNDSRRRIKAPCPFHTETGCSVYTYRTQMCRDYPVKGFNILIKQLLVDSKCAGVQKMISEKKLKGGPQDVVHPSGELPGVSEVPRGKQATEVRGESTPEHK